MVGRGSGGIFVRKWSLISFLVERAMFAFVSWKTGKLLDRELFKTFIWYGHDV
jgi:hypothetical protein